MQRLKRAELDWLSIQFSRWAGIVAKTANFQIDVMVAAITKCLLFSASVAARCTALEELQLNDLLRHFGHHYEPFFTPDLYQIFVQCTSRLRCLSVYAKFIGLCGDTLIAGCADLMHLKLQYCFDLPVNTLATLIRCAKVTQLTVGPNLEIYGWEEDDMNTLVAGAVTKLDHC